MTVSSAPAASLADRVPQQHQPRPSTPAAPAPSASARPVVLVVGCVLGVAYLCALLVLRGGPAAAVLIDLSFVVFPGLAAVACWTATSPSAADQRRTWRWMALAMSVWTAGGVVWCTYSFTRDAMPFPSAADAAFVGYALPVAAALLLLPHATDRLRRDIVLDATVMALAVTFSVWALVLRPVLEAGDGITWAGYVLLAYPVGDIVTISLVLATVMRVRPAELRSWWPLLLGLLVLASTDLLYVHLVARGLYDQSAVYNALWAGAFLLITFAAHHGALAAPTGQRLRVGQALVPYAVLALAVAVTGEQLHSAGGSPALLGIGTLLLVLACVRQVLVVISMTRMTNGLADDVARATDSLRQEREFLRALVESLHVGVMACDSEGVTTFHNRSLALMHGDQGASRRHEWAQDLFTADGSTRLTAEDVPLHQALAGERVEDVELVIRPPGAPGLAFAASGRPLHDPSGAIVGAVVAMHDITHSRRQREALRMRALTDELTGLGNRAAFTEQLRARLDEGAAVGILLCDLDDFKNVNDCLGHEAGDDFLALVAERLTAALPSQCRAFRLGGDEFVVLVDLAGATLQQCAQLVLCAVAEPAQVAGTRVQTTTSIGSALCGPGRTTVGELLKAADLAMYAAKASGKGQVKQYEDHLGGTARDRLVLDADLRAALGTDQLRLVYQPIVDLASGRMTAAEALVRWTHPTRGPVSPVDFIPVAEQSGLILELGAWIMRQACAQLLAWDADGGDSALCLTINVSTRQLERPGLLAVLDGCLRDGVHPSRLVLEVTETALTLDGAAALATMEAVRSRGVHLAVDDFGTGTSSLSRLRSAPVSRIKIDRSFISEITDLEAHVPIVEATMAMAVGLGMGVIAEGVESLEQLRYLRRAGCPEAQGFLLSRPVEAGALPACTSAPPWSALLPLVVVAPDPARSGGQAPGGGDAPGPVAPASRSLLQRRADGLAAWTDLRSTLATATPTRTRLLQDAQRTWIVQADRIRRRAVDEEQSLRVVVGDDDRLPREVLGRTVAAEPGMVMLAEGVDAATTLGIVGAEQPDVLVLDDDFADVTAAEVLDLLRTVSPGTRIVLHAARDDGRLPSHRLLVDRIVHKGADPDALLAALRGLRC